MFRWVFQPPLACECTSEVRAVRAPLPRSVPRGAPASFREVSCRYCPYSVLSPRCLVRLFPVGRTTVQLMKDRDDVSNGFDNAMSAGGCQLIGGRFAQLLSLDFRQTIDFFE